MTDMRLFKLVTSEEIITEVTEETETHYVLKKPRLCAMQQGKDEQGNVGNFLVLLPWIMYATDPTTKTEKDIKLFKHVIAGESEGVQAILEKEYLSATTGLQLL